MQVRSDSPLSGDLLTVCEVIGSGPPAPPSPLSGICQSYRRQLRREPPSVRQIPADQLTTERLTESE